MKIPDISPNINEILTGSSLNLIIRAKIKTYKKLEYPSTLSPTLKTIPLPSARFLA